MSPVPEHRPLWEGRERRARAEPRPMSFGKVAPRAAPELPHAWSEGLVGAGQLPRGWLGGGSCPGGSAQARQQDGASWPGAAEATRLPGPRSCSEHSGTGRHGGLLALMRMVSVQRRENTNYGPAEPGKSRWWPVLVETGVPEVSPEHSAPHVMCTEVICTEQMCTELETCLEQMCTRQRCSAPWPDPVLETTTGSWERRCRAPAQQVQSLILPVTATETGTN